MIVGFPDESEKSVNDTLDLIEKLGAEPFISVAAQSFLLLIPERLNTTLRCGEV